MQKIYKSISDVLERITDGFYAFDINFIVTYWNRRSEEWLGVKREDVLGRNLWQVFPEGIDGAIYTKYHEALETQIPQEFEFFWERDSDWYLVTTYPSQDGVSVFYKNITERKKLEQNLMREIKERQRIVTSAVIAAEEGVRSHIGRELHDNINQMLSVIRLYTEMTLKSNEPRKDLLEKSLGYINECIAEIRSLSKQLSAPTIGSLKLSDSLLDLVNELNLTESIIIHYSTEGVDDLPISQVLHVTLYRIIQEHLNNIIKHADATQVELSIKNISNKIILTIKDNGRGFDFSNRRNGIGVTNMITRAEALRGKISFDTAPGKGCLLLAEFDLP